MVRYSRYTLTRGQNDDNNVSFVIETCDQLDAQELRRLLYPEPMQHDGTIVCRSSGSHSSTLRTTTETGELHGESDLQVIQRQLEQSRQLRDELNRGINSALIDVQAVIDENERVLQKYSHYGADGAFIDVQAVIDENKRILQKYSHYGTDVSLPFDSDANANVVPLPILPSSSSPVRSRSASPIPLGQRIRSPSPTPLAHNIGDEDMVIDVDVPAPVAAVDNAAAAAAVATSADTKAIAALVKKYKWFFKKHQDCILYNYAYNENFYVVPNNVMYAKYDMRMDWCLLKAKHSNFESKTEWIKILQRRMIDPQNFNNTKTLHDVLCHIISQVLMDVWYHATVYDVDTKDLHWSIYFNHYGAITKSIKIKKINVSRLPPPPPLPEAEPAVAAADDDVAETAVAVVDDPADAVVDDPADAVVDDPADAVVDDPADAVIDVDGEHLIPSNTDYNVQPSTSGQQQQQQQPPSRRRRRFSIADSVSSAGSPPSSPRRDRSPSPSLSISSTDSIQEYFALADRMLRTPPPSASAREAAMSYNTRSMKYVRRQYKLGLRHQRKQRRLSSAKPYSP
ncbi:hypothetical protein [Alphabaculovirus altersperidaniae]|uniref:Uncharacterized protein n=1 Tax=Spodoptera eridania nucleopolyhedrovirus TaxID=2315721 RepID=A0ABX6TQ99_9ABAC|nr:hypothetical protein QKS47_gp006 [Spodoptera eridania nucleopolyhedrovirus]QNV47768.1 hypothetical protein [Spodoptera eridania nucleopolyhedrovirus]